MTNRRRNNTRNRASQRSFGKNSSMAQTLTKIADNTSQNIYGQSPQVPDVPRMMLSRRKVYTMAKSFSAATITGSNSVGIGGAITFTLSGLNDAAALADIFDQYRIVQATVAFIPITGSGSTPLYTVLDYDDDNAPAMTDIVQYSTLEVSRSGIVIERTLVPRLAAAVYSGAFTSFSNTRSWIDAASPNVRHYGVKYFLPTLPTSSFATYGVNITMIVQFRSIH